MLRASDDLMESTTVVVDAAPALTVAAVCRVDLAAPIARALAALDLAGRFVLPPARIGPARFGAVWRIDGLPHAGRIAPERFDAFAAPGYVKLTWDVEVVPADDGGALLSIESDFAATDARSAERLLDGWSLIGPLSHALREHAGHAVKAFAEQLADE